MRADFKCQLCGKCCRGFPINIFASDIRRWLSERRSDILMEISFIDNYPVPNRGGFYIAKTTFNPKQPCPFISDNVCSIHETKPRACKEFPNGHEVWEKCPAWRLIGFRVDERKSRRVKKSQSKDQRDTFENRNYLLKRLIEGRRGQFGE